MGKRTISDTGFYLVIELSLHVCNVNSHVDLGIGKRNCVDEYVLPKGLVTALGGSSWGFVVRNEDVCVDWLGKQHSRNKFVSVIHWLVFVGFVGLNYWYLHRRKLNLILTNAESSVEKYALLKNVLFYSNNCVSYWRIGSVPGMMMYLLMKMKCESVREVSWKTPFEEQICFH